MKRNRLFFILLATVILCGCRYSQTYINREEDKKEAQKVTDELYRLIKNSDYKGTFRLYSDSFFTGATREKLLNIYKATNKNLGNLKSTELTRWETKRVEGTNPSAEYALLYTNQYDSFPSTETFRLIREEDGKIRILGYNINSDGFFK